MNKPLDIIEVTFRIDFNEIAAQTDGLLKDAQDFAAIAKEFHHNVNKLRDLTRGEVYQLDDLVGNDPMMMIMKLARVVATEHIMQDVTRHAAGNNLSHLGISALVLLNYALMSPNGVTYKTIGALDPATLPDIPASR